MAAGGGVVYLTGAYDGQGFVAKLNIGVSDISTSGGSTHSELPTALRLGPNYPNPFNPSTTITYEVEQLSLVRITLIDALGRVVGQLLDESHSIRANLGGLPSGTYFYRMEANGFTRVRAMTLSR